MNRDNGAVVSTDSKSVMATEDLEQPPKHPTDGPPLEAAELAVPFAKARGQIPPRGTGAHAPEDGFEKQMVIPCCNATIRGLAR